MSILMHIEHIDGRPSGEYGENGWRMIERIARLTSVPGLGYQLMKNALAYNQLPQIGDDHPSLANMKLVSYRPEIIGKDAVDVTLIYERRSSYPSITVNSTVTTVESIRDESGNLFYTTYDGKKQGGTVTIPGNVATIVVRRREKGDPIDIAATYVGCYNTTAWKIGNRDIPSTARDWKCTGYTGTSTDGIWFDCEISFERQVQSFADGTDVSTFDQEYFYRDPSTGALPDGVIDGTSEVQVLAIKTWTANPTTNFNNIVDFIDFDGDDGYVDNTK